MKTSSRKAKGRSLQDWVKRNLIKYLDLNPSTVHTAIMGQSGADVWLETSVKNKFPFSIECKNTERFKTIYDIIDQARTHSDLTPLAFIKMNRKKPLVILDAEHFIRLVADCNKG